MCICARFIPGFCSFIAITQTGGADQLLVCTQHVAGPTECCMRRPRVKNKRLLFISPVSRLWPEILRLISDSDLAWILKDDLDLDSARSSNLRFVHCAVSQSSKRGGNQSRKGKLLFENTFVLSVISDSVSIFMNNPDFVQVSCGAFDSSSNRLGTLSQKLRVKKPYCRLSFLWNCGLKNEQLI